MRSRNITRRNFLEAAGVAGVAGLTAGGSAVHAAERDPGKRRVCIFTKHLQWMDYQEAADAAKEIGFDGVDIPVRPGGHVLPEKALDDLPRAAEAFRKAGLEVVMVTTAINGVDTPHAEDILKTMRDLEIPIYRMGYLHYDEKLGIAGSLENLKPRVKELADMNRQYGVHGAYQNHSGAYLGAPIWDIWHLIKDLDPRWAGCQYDIRHNVVEGGLSWKVDLELIAPWIRTTVVKDFKWGIVDGSWRVIDTHVGEGMVDFDAYYKEVKRLGIGGPISMHFEYPHKQERSVVTPLFKKDLDTLRAILKKADLS